jgi:hypothetical protein
MVRDTPPYGHAPTYQIVRFLSKTPVYEVSIQGNACSVLAFSSSNDQNNPTWDIISYINLL